MARYREKDERTSVTAEGIGTLAVDDELKYPPGAKHQVVIATVVGFQSERGRESVLVQDASKLFKPCCWTLDRNFASCYDWEGKTAAPERAKRAGGKEKRDAQ